MRSPGEGMEIRQVRTSVLDVAVEVHGPADGVPAVFLHGFPYDPRAFDETADIAARRGIRAYVPYLRGYGATRFLSPATPRSGEQAAIGQDLLDLMDALRLDRAVLAGFDWGARAACIVAALWPERVIGLVSCAGYQIQDIASAARPADPEQERRLWYQYYFHTERGRAGLEENRGPLCRLMWEQWSPTWRFDDAIYQRSARSFDNPDFVDVVIHSYRHRHGNAPGDPRYSKLAGRLAAMPKISVPTIVLQGVADGVNPPQLSAGHAAFFDAPYERRLLEDVGHNPPQEAPESFAGAVLDAAG